MLFELDKDVICPKTVSGRRKKETNTCVGFRMCKICKEDKHVLCYSLNKSYKDELFPTCRECVKKKTHISNLKRKELKGRSKVIIDTNKEVAKVKFYTVTECKTTNWNNFSFYVKTKGYRKSKYDALFFRFECRLEVGEFFVVKSETKKELRNVRTAILKQFPDEVSTVFGELNGHKVLFIRKEK